MSLRPVIVAILSGAGLASVAVAQTPCNARPLMLQVLGSGGPFAAGNRASSGYLIWRDGRPIIMVDAGGGTYLRFAEAGARLADLSLLAISHLHADHVADLPAPRCVTAESDGPFGSLIVPPAPTVDQIRSVVTASARRTIAGIRSDCFAVEGGSAGTIHTVEWCYSPDGLLLFLNDTVEGGRVVTAEATDVARQVSEGDFVLAPT